MFTELNSKAEIKHSKTLITGLMETESESTIIFPDEETIQQELERYRLQLICKHLPDHCTQLLFLS